MKENHPYRRSLTGYFVDSEARDRMPALSSEAYVRGEGLKDYRIMEILTYKGITTAKGFDELQFSAKHRASPCYV